MTLLTYRLFMVVGGWVQKSVRESLERRVEHKAIDRRREIIVSACRAHFEMKCSLANERKLSSNVLPLLPFLGAPL